MDPQTVLDPQTVVDPQTVMDPQPNDSWRLLKIDFYFLLPDAVK